MTACWHIKEIYVWWIPARLVNKYKVSRKTFISCITCILRLVLNKMHSLTLAYYSMLFLSYTHSWSTTLSALWNVHVLSLHYTGLCSISILHKFVFLCKDRTGSCFVCPSQIHVLSLYHTGSCSVSTTKFVFFLCTTLVMFCSYSPLYCFVLTLILFNTGNFKILIFWAQMILCMMFGRVPQILH